MKYDLTTPVYDIAGNPAKSTDNKDGTIYDVLTTALAADMDGDGQTIKGLEKIKRYRILVKLLGHDSVDLTADEVSLLVNAVLIFPTFVAGKAQDFLNQVADAA